MSSWPAASSRPCEAVADEMRAIGPAGAGGQLSRRRLGPVRGARRRGRRRVRADRRADQQRRHRTCPTVAASTSPPNCSTRRSRSTSRARSGSPRSPPSTCRRAASIINISSKASLHPTPFTVVYAAAKAGLNALTKAAASEFGPRGIRVNAIVCGTFHTDSLHASLPTEELQAADGGERRPRAGSPRPTRSSARRSSSPATRRRT